MKNALPPSSQRVYSGFSGKGICMRNVKRPQRPQSSSARISTTTVVYVNNLMMSVCVERDVRWYEGCCDECCVQTTFAPFR